MITKDHPGFKIGPHYSSKEDLPEFDSENTFGEIIIQLENRQRSGFILKVDGQPKYYVKAAVLTSRLDALYEGIDSHSNSKIMDLLTEVPEAFMRIMDIPSEADSISELQQREGTVFAIEEGWFMNHESLSATRTQPLYYYCKNPLTPHKTYSTVIKNCRSCLYPIQR